MADKKVRFSAEENVSPIINKLKRDSEELGRGLIKDARAYTTSGKETLAYIEEQIKAIERRNRAEKQGRLLAIEAEKQRGVISPEKYKSQVSQIGFESKTDEQQVTLLRELIDTVKNTSRREIVEDRKGVDKQLIASKTIDKLDPKGDELSILKETLQRQQLGDVKDQEREEREKFSGRAIAERVNQAGSMVAGSRNEFFMAAAIAGMIPLIGGAISSLMQRALGDASRYQTARGGVYGLTGGGVQRGQGGVLGLTGTTFGEFYELQNQAALARGTGVGMGRAATDILLLSKLGLDKGALLEQEKLGRGGAGGARGATENLVKALQGTGAIKGQDFSPLGEYFSILINIQKEQLKVSGETNDKIGTELIAGITSIDESFKNAEVMSGLLPSIMGSLSRPSTPQAEAFGYGILRQLKPGATLSQLQEMREAPNPELFQAMLSKIRELFPDEEIGVQVIKGIFGQEGKTGIARKMYLGEGKPDISNYKNMVGYQNLEAKAGGATGVLDRSSAKFTRTFETVGDNIVTVVKDLMDENLPEGIKGLKDGITDLVRVIKELGKKFGIIDRPPTATEKETAGRWTVHGKK